MTCREVDKLLDLFLDGELEARTMRAVALHVTRCPTQCEAALQRLERVEDLVAETFNDAVAEIDFSGFWPAVSERAGAIQARHHAPALLRQMRALGARPLVVATAAAALIAAAVLWRVNVAPPLQPVARANNQVRIDSLVTEAKSVALLSEPGANTTVIWVVDEGTVP
jgi:anti-sigma factor RsiW